MELQRAIAGQYRAGLAMLRECVEKCPDDLWATALPSHPRTFWRIAYHTVFYTHFYLMPDHESFTPWEASCWHGRLLWEAEQEEEAPDEVTYTQSKLMEYIDLVSQSIDTWVAAIDFDSEESGFPWYQIPKLDHQILNVRHLGVHTGQLQELLYGRGIDLSWVGRR